MLLLRVVARRASDLLCSFGFQIECDTCRVCGPHDCFLHGIRSQSLWPHPLCVFQPSTAEPPSFLAADRSRRRVPEDEHYGRGLTEGEMQQRLRNIHAAAKQQEEAAARANALLQRLEAAELKYEERTAGEAMREEVCGMLQSESGREQIQNSFVQMAHDADIAKMKLLLSIPTAVDINKYSTDNYCTALSTVVWQNDEVAEFLVAQKADPNARDKNGQSALFSAFRQERKISDARMARLIAAGADVNHRDDDGRTVRKI